MTANLAPASTTHTGASALAALLDGEGTAGHAYCQSTPLLKGPAITRNLADVVHHFTLLHGRHPGVIDHAALHTVHPASHDWLRAATDGFTRERAYLTKLTVAVGPIPSTPGQAATEAAVVAQRHALGMLAQSDRFGCAFGAAVALVSDWHSIRPLLEMAGRRVGFDAPDCHLPDQAMTFAVVDTFAENPAVERAVSFGAQQLIHQHRGLWDLMQARQIARGND